MCAFVLSKLDYCNSLLSGSPQYILDKLQKVQNSAARLVLKRRKRDHVQPLFKQLHWLPVRSRIQYKVSTLCFNTFACASPDYLSELLTVYIWLGNSVLLQTVVLFAFPPQKQRHVGKRAFTGPTQWNALSYVLSVSLQL